LNSSLDSLVRLTDASGKVLHWNDDHVLKDEHLHMDRLGLVTHHADSYLTTQLPDSGSYYVHLSDAQNHGSDDHAYRLRISAPRGDFALRVTPSSLHALPGSVMPICVYAIRRDGFDGRIDVQVKSPSGFQLEGGRIPAGCNRMRMTLKAPRSLSGRPVVLELEGVAEVDGRPVRRSADPADNVMQAFLYRHLLPAQDLMVATVPRKWPVPSTEVAGEVPVRIPAGGSKQVVIRTNRKRLLQEFQLEINDPPRGLSLSDVSAVPDGLAFQLSADRHHLKDGFSGNVIVETFREFTPKTRDGRTATKRRQSVGFLPAIPVEVVPP
jgi:hypothetical protein